MADTKISVIVPVYSVEAYLLKCLNSIVNQTYQNLEIILVNDGSPDSCGVICDEYAAKDERIKVIHKANGGVSSARNVGLAAATGDYIGWVDSDDWIETDMFEYLLDGARECDADVAVCGRIEAYSDHQRAIGWERKTVLSRNEAIRYLLEDGVLRNYLWDKLWRRELFRDIVFPEGKTFEDVATVYRLLEKADKVVCLPECKYFYLQREDGIVQSRSLRNVMNCYEAEKERYLYLRDSCPEFQPQMEKVLVLAAARIWEVYLMDSAGNRRQYRDQLEKMAVFAREHPSAVCNAGQSLGLAGRLLLRLTKHAVWWAYIMAGFTGWVYRCKRRWLTGGEKL